MMKRITKSLLCFVFMLSLVWMISAPLSRQAMAAEEGICGENLTWTYSNGVLTIDGSGPMSGETPWGSLKISEVKKIKCSEGLTQIAYRAFDGFDSLTEVILPESLTSIGSDAFANCSKLTKITLAAGNPVYKVEDNILYSKNSWGEDYVIELYPAGKKDTVYNVPSYVKNIRIHNPYLETITSDHYVYFTNRSLTGCVNLRKIPEDFGSFANSFAECGLTEITIPNDWKEFYECDSSGQPLCNMKNLKKVIVHNDNKYFKSVDGILYNSDMTSLCCYPPAKAGTVFRVPDGVEHIYNLYEALNLKNVIIPASVKRIDMNGPIEWERTEPNEFDSITDIYYLGSKEQWESVQIQNSFGKKPTQYTIHYVTKDSYSIKANVTPEGSGTVSGTGTKLLTSKATLKASPKPGYSFKRWTENGKSVGTSSSLTISSVTKARTFTAEFVPGKFTVTFNANNGTKLSAKTKSVTYLSKYGTMPTVVRSGYAFKGWYTAKTGGSKVTSSTVYKSTANKTLYAQWTRITVAKAAKPVLKNPLAGQLKISWTSVSGAKGYQIKYATNSTFSSAKTTSTTSLTKTIKSLTKGKTYYVKIRAYKVDSAGNKVYGSYGTAASLKLSK